MDTKLTIRPFTGGEIKRPHIRRTIRVTMLLLFALLIAGCSIDGAVIGKTPPPTRTVDAADQDIIPTPVVTATATAPATATLAPATPTSPPRPPAPTATPKPQPPGVPAAPSASGKVILVSLSRQQLYAYENDNFTFTILVETGRPELPTPTGLYHIFYKSCSDLRWTSNTAPTSAHNVNCTQHNGDGFQEVFRSPWPEGSPYWYAPTHINYALKFRDDGYYLHDAWWHEAFGLGSNVPHKISTGEWETGSHGCVGMPTTDAEKLYAWASIGTAVYVRADV
jgi:lipoprotein-anchoring transpeptidase ErfK/SrfK